jgi:hypothetical protein
MGDEMGDEMGDGRRRGGGVGSESAVCEVEMTLSDDGSGVKSVAVKGVVGRRAGRNW